MDTAVEKSELTLAVEKGVKFIEDRFSKVAKSIKDRKKEITGVNTVISSLTVSLEALRQTHDENSPGVIALQSTLNEHKDKAAKLESYNESQSAFLIEIHRNNSAVLEVLRMVCPHKHTVFDHNDYHNNVDYDRCLACGHVF